MEVISREAAKALGRKKYYTGKPCKHGHVDERYVALGKCVACRSAIKKAYYANNQEKVRGNNKKYKTQYSRKVSPERASAQERGDLLYSTGIPCVNGHSAPRYASDSRCVVCNSNKKKGWKAKNPHRVVASAGRVR